MHNEKTECEKDFLNATTSPDVQIYSNQQMPF